MGSMLHPQNLCSLEPVKVTLFLERVFANKNKAHEMISPSFRMGVKSEGALRHRDIWRRRPCNMETEIGVMYPQAKGCLGSPKPGKARNGCFLEPVGKHGPAGILISDVCLQNCDMINYCFTHQF